MRNEFYQCAHERLRRISRLNSFRMTKFVTIFKIGVLFASVLVLIQAQENCELEQCPVYGENEIEHVLTLLPVPWNCSEYIMCDRGVQHIRPCPPGLHFIPSLHVCEFPDRATCVETCSSLPGVLSNKLSGFR